MSSPKSPQDAHFWMPSKWFATEIMPGKMRDYDPLTGAQLCGVAQIPAILASAALILFFSAQAKGSKAGLRRVRQPDDIVLRRARHRPNGLASKSRWAQRRVAR
jgi:hypothetical protein